MPERRCTLETLGPVILECRDRLARIECDAEAIIAKLTDRPVELAAVAALESRLREDRTKRDPRSIEP